MLRKFEFLIKQSFQLFKMSKNQVPKKFINNVNSCVDDFLTGLVSSDQDLTFHPTNHRVVLREDYQKICGDGVVAFVSGGGSGHEPFVAGKFQVFARTLTHPSSHNNFISPYKSGSRRFFC